MIVRIGQFEITECWDGVFYKKLSSYPHITEWEIQTVLDFVRYEEANGRACPIEAEESILAAIEAYRPVYETGVRVAPPDLIRECTACLTYQGCRTDLVCHTSPLENAVKILDCGSLLSPVLARGLSAEELQAEARNAANDPADYFEYVMFSWGNCQAGDRLVMERKLGRFPDEKDLSVGFTPGVRFFFRFKDLARHPKAVFEGVLPLKVRDEVVLKDFVHAIVAPEAYRRVMEPHVPEELKDKVHFLENDCRNIWEWSEKVYEFARSLMPIRIETVQTDTFAMDFFRFGRGKRPLVILPGISVQSVMGAADAVASAYQPLEDTFTIYVFDRRKNLPPVYTVRDMVRDTADAFRALGLTDVCLFGASQGGMIALVMAIEYPELVGRMALGSTSAHVKEAQYRVIEKWIDLAKRKDKTGLYLSFGEEIYPPEVFAQYRDALTAAAASVTDEDLERFIVIAEGTKGFDVTEDLDRIQCPVLAVGVYDDNVLDPDATMEIAEKLDFREDFRLYMYAGFGHAAFDTAPDYRERLLAFFRDQSEGECAWD